MAKNKFYAVKIGRNPGIYTNWSDAEQQVKGFTGADFKGCATHEDAVNYLKGNSNSSIISGEEGKKDKVYFYVDGSRIGTKIGSGVVVVKNNEILFKDATRYPANAPEGNIAGEIYATIRTIQLVMANDYRDIAICYDYEGIEKFITGEFEAGSALTKRYVDYFNQYIINNKIQYEFINISSHTGHKYNELADKLAQLGTEL